MCKFESFKNECFASDSLVYFFYYWFKNIFCLQFISKPVLGYILSPFFKEYDDYKYINERWAG